MRKLLSNRQINNAGYTIIEMLVVMVIMSITVALAAPNFDKIIGAYQLDISAREMASDIRDLQQTAIKTQSSTYSIKWYDNANTYYLHKTDSIAYKTVKLPSSVDLVYAPIKDGFTQLFFKKSGLPENGGGTVKLMDKVSNKEKYVIVNKLGRVRVSETPPE